MATGTNQYNPNYAVPPGWILEEHLEVQGLSQAEFARRCECSPRLISGIISGKAPLEPETALRFEKALGMEADIWLGIEANYRLRKARKADAEAAAAAAEWGRYFPVRDLVKRGCFRRPESDADAVSKLLAFFGVASVSAWTAHYGYSNVAYRHAAGGRGDEAAWAVWRRLGELEAENQNCADYERRQFNHAVREIRGLTREPAAEALREAADLCNRAGVVLALASPPPGTALGGAAWWLSSRKAIIQLSTRHKSDDRLWLGFFHEAAHILLHGKKEVFVDEAVGGHAGIEAEADEWAAAALVPRKSWKGFAARSPHDERAVREFADEQGIAPGILVGLLQRQGLLPKSRLNGLKAKLALEAEAGRISDRGVPHQPKIKPARNAAKGKTTGRRTARRPKADLILGVA